MPTGHVNCRILYFLLSIFDQNLFPYVLSKMMFPVQIILMMCVLILPALGHIGNSPIVYIPQGGLLGEEGRSSVNQKLIYKFWCIPYGKAERFEPSKPADSWPGVREATECNVHCPQSYTFVGNNEFQFGAESEDCLILNVFTPAKAKKDLPVMFWIHGGYFTVGSSVFFSGKVLLNEDVVVVTINYRLGPFGFLTTGDGVIDANLGMKDMVLALEWVRDNIKYFGGDKDKVTIFGQSAGGAAVGLLVLSPMAKGLFRAAIAQSGSSMMPCAYEGKPIETFERFAAAINCSAPTSQESVDCLKAKSFPEVAEISTQTKWAITALHPVFPAVERAPNLPRKSPIFLPDYPRKMYKEGNFNKVPLIIGLVEDDGAIVMMLIAEDEEVYHDINYRWVPTFGDALALDNKDISQANINLGLRKMRELYFGFDDLITGRSDQAQALVDIMSDVWFTVSMDTTIRHHSQYAPVYPYIFTKKGGMKLAEASVGPLLNKSVVSHGEDLPYIFMKGMVTSAEDMLFADRFLSLWVSFAGDTKPTATWGSAATWPAAETNTFDYLYYILDDDTSLMPNPFKARVQLRNELDEHEWKDYTDD